MVILPAQVAFLQLLRFLCIFNQKCVIKYVRMAESLTSFCQVAGEVGSLNNSERKTESVIESGTA